MKKILLFLGGMACLVLGLAMVLKWWPEVALLFRGVGGMAVAFIGIIMLYLIKEV